MIVERLLRIEGSREWVMMTLNRSHVAPGRSYECGQGCRIVEVVRQYIEGDPPPLTEEEQETGRCIEEFHAQVERSEVSGAG